jgi:hypothetical protein
MRRWLITTLAGLMVWACASARADVYLLEFEGRASGLLGLGRATVRIDYGDSGYTVSASLRSAGLLALFERTTLNASALGDVVDGMPAWRSYVLDHAYSAKRRQIRMTRHADRVEAFIEPTYRVWGDPPASESQQLASRDPLSTFVALGAAVGQSRTCSGAFPTYDGRFHYRLELSGGRVTRFDDGGFEGQVLRCEFAYVPVAGFEPEDGGGRGRIPRGQIWFALVEGHRFAPPVRVSSPLPLGEAAVVLRQLRRGTVAVEATPQTLLLPESAWGAIL